MAKWIMAVQSRAVEGRDDDYNEWYDTVHKQEICAVEGVQSCRRFDYAMAMMGEPGLPYLSIYEIEADDIMTVVGALGQRAQSGEMTQTDSLDGPASVLWFYKEREAA
jgi:hypothetical protein